MRKKYLSALLFGALLVTSAGTFTSCKDYDDEINNLQEQITSNKDAIAALQKLVGEGKWVTSISPIENGFTVTMSDGTTTEIKGINGEDGQNGQDGKPGTMWKINETTFNWEYSEDGGLTWVDTEVCAKGEKGEQGEQGPAGETGPQGPVGEAAQNCPSPKIENGEWVCYEYNAETGVYDEVKTGIKAEAVNVWAEDKGDYIILHVGDQSYELPANEEAATPLTVSFNDSQSIFGGDTWGIVTADNLKWNGNPIPKNTILMSGEQKSITISVSPYNVELNNKKIKLVDTEGNEADATVTPKPLAELPSDGPAVSRAVSVNGKWELVIDLKDVKTNDKGTEITNFKTEDGNILYALEVDGKIVTPYSFNIIPGVKSTTDIEANDATFTVNGKDYTVGTTKLSFTEDNKFTVEIKDGQKNILNDAYFTFEGRNLDVANSLGVSAEGLTIKGSPEAAGRSVRATLHVLGVNGSVDTRECVFTFATSEVEAGEVSVADHKATAKSNKELWVSVDGVFSYEEFNKFFTNTEGVLTHKGNYRITTKVGTDVDTDYNELFASDDHYTYVAYKNDKETLFKSTDKISDLKYIKVTTTQNYSADAKDDVNTFAMTISHTTTGEVKKLSADFNVTLPSFDEMFTKVTGGSVWNGETYIATVTEDSSSPVINLGNAFSAKATEYDKSDLTVGDIKVDNKTAAVSGDNIKENITLKKTNDADATIVIDTQNGKIAVKTLPIEVSYAFGGMKVTKSFNVQLRSIFEGAEINYYVNGVAQADDYTVKTVFNGINEIIPALTLSGTNNSIKNGLAISFNGSEDGWDTNLTSVGGITISASNPSTNNEVKYELKLENTSYKPTTPTLQDDGIKVKYEEMEPNKGGTLLITITDNVGIKMVKKINYAK